MRVLALECSTDESSLAFLDGQQVLLERVWTGHEGRRQVWARDLYHAVTEGLLPLDRVDRLAVGVGPGAFSGLRMAIAFIRGVSLPAGTPVHGVSSGAALAWRTHHETGASRVVVVGDARRNELWIGRFRCDGAYPAQEGIWEVVPHDRVSSEWTEGGVVWVSPDWHRIGASLKGGGVGGGRLIEARCHPRARDVAELAAAGVAAGLAPAPLVPMYLNPAVVVAPRFAAG